MGTLYLLRLFGPFVLVPAVPLILAALATSRWVRDPGLLLAIAILTSLVGTLSVAETAFGSYEVWAGRLGLVIECTELDLIAVVLGLIALRRLKARISLTLGLLIGCFAIVFTVITTTGIHQVIAANILNIPDWGMQTGVPDGSMQPYLLALQRSIDSLAVDVVTIITPAVAMVLFWPIWLLSIGRPHASARLLWTLFVAFVGVPVIAVVTWMLLPGLTGNGYRLGQILLHEALVPIWWIAIAVGWHRARSALAPTIQTRPAG